MAPENLDQSRSHMRGQADSMRQNVENGTEMAVFGTMGSAGGLARSRLGAGLGFTFVRGFG